MGLDLTWREKDQIRFGECGEFRNEVVGFGSSRPTQAEGKGIASSPERDSNYRIYTEEIVEQLKIDVPAGKAGYAFEYVEMEVPLTLEIATARLKPILEERYSDHPNRDKVVAAEISRYFSEETIGYSAFGGITGDQVGKFVRQRQFVRWVSRDVTVPLI